MGRFMRAVGVAALVLLTACADDEEVNLEEQSAEEIFAEAEADFEDFPADAAELYEELERVHPYDPLAKTAMLRAGEAYYRAGKFDEAIAAAGRFLEFYPGDELAPQAQFIVALSYYDRIPDVRRDQAYSDQAQQELRNLVQRYPDSPYAIDGALMLDAARDHLSGKEMTVGRFYLRTGHYAAAINRFRVVIEQYPSTTHVAEALHRMVEANLRLGLVGEARRAAAILGYNFPGSEWYQDSYQLLQQNGGVSDVVEG